MCGIVGAAWTVMGRSLSRTELSAMVARLTHRGPDDQGIYLDPRSALGFRRLSIIDLQGSHQPLANEDQTVWVVFNGEIYNYQALRHRLEARGHTLRTSGDTEVLVHLYEDEGPNLFSLLRGMFAVAIWDSTRHCLLLGRDRLGQKPLLYSLQPGRILFSSELKGLLALPSDQFPAQLDPVALDAYLALGYIPYPHTILDGVYKLPPAHYAIWHQDHLSLKRYWEPDWSSQITRPEAEDAERLRSLLTEAVAEQMLADVPLGAFLSGGIDSTIIVGLMQKAASAPVKTFSIAFDEPAFDESHYAEMAARHLGTEHHTFHVRPEAWNTLPSLAAQFDEPFADSSALPTWHVARETRGHVTVALTGDAGDELFGGYDRYRALAICQLLDRLPASSARWLAAAFSRALPESTTAKSRFRKLRRLLDGVRMPAPHRYLAWMGLFDEFQRAQIYSLSFCQNLADLSPPPDPPEETILRCFRLATARDPVTLAMIADLLTYLPGDLLHKVDMASMAHSLECRAPFLDHRVVEFALALPLQRKLGIQSGRSKILLKDTFQDLLPPPIRSRSKMGFGVPIGRWFREDLACELREVLFDPVCLNRGLFRPEEIARLLDEHEKLQRDHAPKLWALLMLELWFRHHLDPHRPAPDNPALADVSEISQP